MRRLLPFAFLALSACASVPPAAPPRVAAPAVTASTPDDAAIIAALSRAGAADALTLDQAAALLGKPDLERRDGLGVFQTYRLEPCALLLSFAVDARGVQRLRGAEAGVRRAGDPAPDVTACYAAAATRGRAGGN